MDRVTVMPYRPVLLSERLRLRPFEMSDLGAVQEYASDPHVTRMMDWGPNDERATRAFVEIAAAYRPREAEVFHFAITLQGDHRLVGGCSLAIESAEHRRASFGYVLSQSHWGYGFATEAALCLRDFAFGALGIHRMEATCHPDNLASARVLTKTGLVLEGRMRDHMLVRGEWRDSLLFGLTTDDLDY